MQRFTAEEVGITPEQIEELRAKAIFYPKAETGHRDGEYTIVDGGVSWPVYKSGVYITTMAWQGSTPAHVACVPQDVYLANAAQMKDLGLVPTSELQLRGERLSLSLAQMLEMMVPNGHRLELPTTFAFQPGNYRELKKALTNAGGRYSKSGFDFASDEDAAEILERLMGGESINLRQSLQYFPTTDMAGDRLLDGLDLEGKTVLEPSAGEGYLVRRAAKAGATKVLAVEIYPKFHGALEASGAEVVGTDLLAMEKGDIGDVDVVLMNPPFSGGQDIRHVEHVLKVVPGHTEIRAIMSSAVVERTGGIYDRFREFLDSVGGVHEQLPAGAFKESGTMVRTCIVRIPARATSTAAA